MEKLEPAAKNPSRMPGVGLGACAIRAHLESRAFDTKTLISSLLEKIRQHEPVTQAWEWLDEARAISSARDRDTQYAASLARPLEGIPFGIKDIIETQGVPTRMGSPLFADYVPEESAPVIRALEDAGAIILGKTVTTEFATQCPGKTRNPWNQAYSPGGSSSGSAAAVAAGFVPAALGTQTRGSTIRPAAFCGVVGYKPTLGAISTSGIFPTSVTLDHVGIFARSVEDISLISSVCVPDSNALAPAPGKPPILAFVKSPYWSRAEPPQRRCIEAALQSFTAAGAQVKHVELPPAFDGALNAINQIQRFELFQLHGNRLEDWRPALSRQFLDYMESGRRITVPQYREALAYRDKLIGMYDDIISPFSAVVTPPANGEAPEGLTTTGDATFCVIWTLCGAPAISLPAGRGPHGLPLGIQLVGHRHYDGSLLQTALWCEAVLQRSQCIY